MLSVKYFRYILENAGESLFQSILSLFTTLFNRKNTFWSAKLLETTLKSFVAANMYYVVSYESCRKVPARSRKPELRTTSRQHLRCATEARYTPIYTLLLAYLSSFPRKYCTKTVQHQAPHRQFSSVFPCHRAQNTALENQLSYNILWELEKLLSYYSKREYEQISRLHHLEPCGGGF